MRMMPAWHDEARALHRDGVPIGAIARRFGKQASQIRYLVDSEYHERRTQQTRAARARSVGRNCTDPVRSEMDLRRKPKSKPAVPQIDTMAVCAQFARGEIDRAELSRRLRGEV